MTTTIALENDPVRVCVVNPNFYRSSGITVAVKTIYAATSALGIEQTFVSCNYGDGEEDTSWLPDGRATSFRLMDRNPVVLIKELCAFGAWIRRKGVSIVHVHHRRLAAILCACKSFLGCSIIYTGNLTYPFAAWFWPVKPDLATAVSDSVAHNMRHTTRVRDIRLISNTTSFPEFSGLHPWGNVVVDAVCIGRLEPVKGHQHLIRAWALLRDQGFRAKLALVGEGSLRAQLQSQVNESALGELIEFRGFRTDVQSEILRSRFSVLTSQVEGQGIAVLEAAACCRASLVTDVDGLRDCMPPSGVLPNGVPFGNAIALASALKVWLSNSKVVEQEGQMFREFLRKTSSREVVGEQYALLYRQAALQKEQ
jgi:glycosyltransferase involved in cell wall biosynthesis